MVSASQEQLYEFKKGNAGVMWKWDIVVDNCAICKNHIMEPCIDCQASQISNADECNQAWGACNHVFHIHCIQKWTKNHSTCPLCARDWELTKYGS